MNHGTSIRAQEYAPLRKNQAYALAAAAMATCLTLPCTSWAAAPRPSRPLTLEARERCNHCKTVDPITYHLRTAPSSFE